MRYLIVNADDFGLSPGVNAGIVQAHEHGIVTSASLMVRQPAAEAAAAYARGRPALGLGLHVDLGEWAFRDGHWHALYERVPPDDAAAVEDEVHGQLERFRKLVGRDPDHLDSHQHVHRREPARAVLESLAARLRLPLRGMGATRYRGEFYGQGEVGEPQLRLITVDALLAVIDSLEAGVSELSCHPGLTTEKEPLRDTMYRHERNIEVSALCDRRVRDRLARGDIVLCRHSDCPKGIT
jgi:predicted glycoside hydrolase/deacetylase ChbG (UPF0249 family)